VNNELKTKIIYLVAAVLIIVLGIPLGVFLDFKKESGNVKDRILRVKVLNYKTRQIIDIPLEEYLVGVVAAEMPANFEIEALKAQAIAARTYTIKRLYRFGGKPRDEHLDAEICTDSTHCQAWCDNKELIEKWGQFKYQTLINKIRSAVETTKYQIIMYNNSLIDPVYHTSCGGKGTKNSEDVWLYNLPYLRSVKCNQDYKLSAGKGHAVGMCQYGANGMALLQKDYREILLYYYSGIQIEKIKY
jgi:stage II sporulation protein D